MAIKWFSIGTKRHIACQKIISFILTHHQLPKHLVQSRINPCFVYTKFWPYHLSCKSRLDRQGYIFSNLVIFGVPVEIVSSVSCSYLMGVASGLVFCRSCALRFHVSRIQTCCSEYLGYTKWLFQLLGCLSSRTSLPILLWCLTLTRHFNLHHCKSDGWFA